MGVRLTPTYSYSLAFSLSLPHPLASQVLTSRTLGPANQRPTGNNNPNLFRPPTTTKSPKPSDGRKVAFSESVEDIDAYSASPKVPPKDSPASAAKTSKWQPLSTVEPSPIAENDPFSLGDSEDEKETKEKGAGKEIKMEDTERLRQAAAEAMADSLVDEKKDEADKKE